jgi:hypothetical protein
MQMIILNGNVECPACGLTLTKIREQDRRVHIMHHPPTEFCSSSDKNLRVDRLNGYSEIFAHA